MSVPRLLIAGGGTGGHLFPGVAVAEEFRGRYPDAEVLFVGTEKGIEARILPELGWNLQFIEVSGLKTVGLLGAVRGALRIPGALKQSRALIREFKPTTVIGVGGYASGPVVLAAQRMKIPTAILEQNSVPGLTNRILGKFVDKIFLSFAHSQSFFKARKSELVGNPIRPQILDTLDSSRPERSPDNPLRLFIFGGSQGALSVNQMSCEALATLSDSDISFSIVHQTGSIGLEAAQTAYAEAQIDADCRAFISDMAAEYTKADIIISRAGATTIAELGIAGVPTVLIPYPYAANNHQELNAEEMVGAGAARMLLQGDGASEKLAEILKELQTDSVREKMATAMRSFARPDAAREIVDWIQSQKE